MNIEDAVLYICKKYPHPHELSKARLTKLIYLADWEACKKSGSQLTNIEWYFHNFGPYVEDVIDAARNSKHLNVVVSANMYGDPKELVSAAESSPLPLINRSDADILDSVMEATRSMYWKSFISHVYSTPPIVGSDKYTTLDMKKFATRSK